MKKGPKPKNEHLHCSGAYGIIYKPDMKFRYIGVSKNIKQRWHDHRYRTKGKQYNDDFHIHLRANRDDYECVVLYEYDGIIKNHSDLYEKLVPIECFLIEHFKLLGHPIVSPAENQTGTWKRTDDEKAKISAGKKGHSVSDETKAKLSVANKGKTLSDETKAKISAKNSGENHPLYGCTGEKSANWHTKWMHKPNETPIIVKECDIETKKKEGYIFGRK